MQQWMNAQNQDFWKIMTKTTPELSDPLRQEEINFGLAAGLDVSIYDKPEFSWSQMKEIRLGLLRGLDVSVYAKPEFDQYQMSQIRWGLEDNLDVSIYAKPEFSWTQMEEIRLKLKKGLDVSAYIKQKDSDKDITLRMDEYFDELENGSER